MTQYTDYTFYTGQYGGELTEEQFRRVIVPVSAHIRRITFDRADRSMEEVQHAACACCDPVSYTNLTLPTTELV